MRDRRERAHKMEEAARYIEKHGWTAGKLVSPSGAVCIYGALMKVEGQYDFGEGSPELTSFNDLITKQVTTSLKKRKEMVLFLLRWRAQEIRDGR